MAPSDVGYPFMGPPGLLPDVRDTLRKAFADTMKDPAFVAEAEKVKFELYPIDGPKLQGMIDRLYKASPAVIERAKKLGTPQ
jgi:hypothetical protein